MKNEKINLQILARLHSKYERQIVRLSARQTAEEKKFLKNRKRKKS